MPVGQVTDPLYFKKYATVKAGGWRRSWPNSKSFGAYWQQYCFRQRLARRAPWDRDKWEDCVASLVEDLRDVRLDPLRCEDTPSCFSDLSASAGLGLSGNKEFLNKGEVPMHEIFKCYDRLAAGRLHLIPDYSIAFRSHLVRGDAQAKTRVVLVTPGPLAFVEKIFAEPLFRALKARRFPKPWATGFDWFSGDGSRVLQTFGAKSLSLDFSSFDLCAPIFMIKDVFRVIASCFSLTSEQALVLESIATNHTDAHVLREGKRYHLEGGIRTGSSFTHIVGTFVCILMVRYLTSLDVESLSFGDDVVLNTNVKLRVIMSRAHNTSSFSISVSKSKRGVHWLGLHYKSGFWEVEDPQKRWGQLFLPEHVGNDATLQVQLLHAHLLAAGTGVMAAELRLIIQREGCTSLTKPSKRLLKKMYSLPEDVFEHTGRNVLDVERHLKALMDSTSQNGP
uniref:RdRp n=1 Tax=Wenling partiti-like virus 10 TaxID=1923516 RepID=A0A1L3KLY9_9VIRU|nr:RdRp [Wenling partiti-like virus 10]